MENSSKALLIAAAVLIVIILIAFGMSVLNSPKDTVEHAQGVGDSISDASQTALGKLEASFNKGQTIDVSSMLTEEQKRGDADITSAQLAKIILGDENKSLGSYNGNWRVIGQNVVENGKTHSYKLVSTSNVGNVQLGYKDINAVGNNDLEKVIDSYAKAENTLNQAAKNALKNISSNGKVQVRSINIEDLEILLGINHAEDDPKHGEEYEYYRVENGKIYNKNNSVAPLFKEEVYDAIVNNEILNKKLKIQENGGRIKITVSWQNEYDIEEHDYLKNDNYWLAFTNCESAANNGSVFFSVNFVLSGCITGEPLFRTNKEERKDLTYGIRTVVLI